MTQAVQTERTVLIVDDHCSFAESLAISLASRRGFSVIGIAHLADEAVLFARRHGPDAVVLDIRLGTSDGLSVARRIRAALPRVVIVIATAYDGWSWIARAASAGANGYVAKAGSLSELVEVLRAARPETFVVAPSLRRHHARPPAIAERQVTLTPREAQVLALMDDGVCPKQMARVLDISVNTCRGYVKSMYAKLGVGSQVEALATARRFSLIGRDVGDR